MKQLKQLVRGLINPQSRARRQLRLGLDWDDFFAALAGRGIRYAVLRWFESLPAVAPGEDVDLLIADEDIGRIGDLCGRWRSGRVCDVYSVTGLPGSDFRKMAYYPPRCAQQILERAVRLHDRFRVPCLEDHFLSLAYHAVYHKGYASGLPGVTAAGATGHKVPDHDYRVELAALASALGIDVAIDLESLDAYLAGRGWRPPYDMLSRLAFHNRWIFDRFLKDGPAIVAEHRGLALFLIRERAEQLGYSARVVEQLKSEGFHILDSPVLPPDARERAIRQLRGGNWGRGKWPRSGGPPVQAIIAWDPEPLAVQPRIRRDYPLLSNGRILRAKESLRDWVLAQGGRGERFNALHSSDNDLQAWEYLEVLFPEQLDSYRVRIAGLNRGGARP
ncbi:MAG: hypothetical protein WD929_00355 [Steroidobacteraceae bacterium]